MNKSQKALVVFSGGQDSTTCLCWAMKNFKKVYTISFDYGQRHKKELEAAKKIAKELKVPNKVVKIGLFKELTKNALTDESVPVKSAEERSKGQNLPSTFVDGRNLIFLSAAAIYAKSLGIKDIVTGVCETDYSGYPDCRDEFIKSLENTLNLAMEYEFKIHTPLMWLNKAESVKMMKRLKGLKLLKYTQTCYEGRKRACGICPACKLRLKGFQEAGEEDPVEYEK